MGQDHSFQEGIAGQPIGAVQTGAGDLADGIESRQTGCAVSVGLDPATLIMSRRHHRDRLFRNIDAKMQTGLVDVGKAFPQEFRRTDG